MSKVKEDYYELLGVAKTASADEIKKSYRKMAMKFHPDRNPGNKEAEERFKKVSEAYEVLSDEQKRAAYDRYGHAAFQGGAAAGPRGPGGGGFHDPYDIFREVFGGAGGGIFEEFFGGGGGGGGGGGSGVARGQDLRYDLEISLEEASAGVEKEVSFRKPVECAECKGSGAEPGSKATRCPTCGGSGQVTRARVWIVPVARAVARAASTPPPKSKSRCRPVWTPARNCAPRKMARLACTVESQAISTS
jgi:molecular chaperone DnaJ